MKSVIVKLSEDNLSEINKYLEDGFVFGQQFHVPASGNTTVFIQLIKYPQPINYGTINGPYVQNW